MASTSAAPAALAAAKSGAPAPRAKPARRSRKRRRRQNSYSVSSDSNSDSDDDDDNKPAAQPKAGPSTMEVDGSDGSSSSSSSDSSVSDSDSDSDFSSSSSSSSSSSARSARPTKASAPAIDQEGQRTRNRIPEIRANSPTPPPLTIPSFLPTKPQAGGAEDNRRAAFKRVYMEKLADGFSSDLDKLRTADPTMNPARLKRLIASLEEATNLYSAQKISADEGKVAGDAVDEIAVVLAGKK